MSSRKLRQNTPAAISVDLGCSCRRRSSRLFTALFHKFKSQTAATHYHSASKSAFKNVAGDNYSDDEDIKGLKPVHLELGRKGGDSVAVEKDSDDPYLDFRRSMMSMIVEKEIYSKDDLRELLNCFLQLNNPYHHGIIIRAFSEIWNGVYYSAASLHGGQTMNG